jgi:hypothetical protein
MRIAVKQRAGAMVFTDQLRLGLDDVFYFVVIGNNGFYCSQLFIIILVKAALFVQPAVYVIELVQRQAVLYCLFRVL